MLNNFFIILVAKENTIVNPVLAIPAGAPTIVAWETIQTPPIVAERTIKILSMSSNAVTYLLIVLLYNFLWLIYELK